MRIPQNAKTISGRIAQKAGQEQKPTTKTETIAPGTYAEITIDSETGIIEWEEENPPLLIRNTIEKIKKATKGKCTLLTNISENYTSFTIICHGKDKKEAKQLVDTVKKTYTEILKQIQKG